MFKTILIQPLANGLIIFYKYLGGNMGVSIIMFSLFLRFILNPLTKPYLESAKKMKEVASLVEKLKKKYKNDKIKLAQAQSELYKQKGINPGAGCLPYILQIVVLIAFFNVFTNTLYPGKDTLQEFNKLLYPPLQFQSGDVINTKFLYLDIKTPDVFKISGFPISLPGPILILATILQVLSAQIMLPYEKIEEKIAKKTKSEGDDMQVAMQKSMTYTFPIFTLIFGMNFPSGLAIYWTVFSAFQLWQQYKTSGWGGLTPWLQRLNLVKSS